MKNQTHSVHTGANLPIHNSNKAEMNLHLSTRLDNNRKQSAIKVLTIGISQKVKNKAFGGILNKKLLKISRNMDFDTFSKYLASDEFLNLLDSEISNFNQSLISLENSK